MKCGWGEEPDDRHIDTSDNPVSRNDHFTKYGIEYMFIDTDGKLLDIPFQLSPAFQHGLSQATIFLSSLELTRIVLRYH